jgi:hypothetical protein
MTQLTKILFVVDTSGSNVIRTKEWGTIGCLDNDMTCLPPSDPDKNFRARAIGSFLGKYRQKSNFQWSMLTFADQSAHAFINKGNDQSPLFAAAQYMDQALGAFMGFKDNGPTPYGAGLQLATKAIQDDADLNAATKPNYVVILLTDGFPTDYYDANNVFQPSMAISDVNTLSGLASAGRVTLSTLYYNPNPDHNAPEPQKAITLLKAMATQGGGHFRSVNPTDGTFNIDDLIPGATKDCK